jgi:hypothetical protein
VFRNWWSYVNEWAWWSTGGERLGAGVSLWSGGQLRNYWFARLGLDRNFAGLSTEALRGGPALLAPSRWRADLLLQTDRRPAVSGELSTLLQVEDGTDSRRLTVSPAINLRLAGRAALSVGPSVTWNRNAWQFITAAESPDDTTYLTGRLAQTTAALTTRLDYIVTPNLSLQLYAQPFLSAGAYDDFRTVASPRARRFDDRLRSIEPGRLRYAPIEARYTVDADGGGRDAFGFDDPAFNVKQLGASAVVRWEYRPGSTVFLVWGHSRTANEPSGDFRLGPDTRRLFEAQSKNVVAVKVSYWMSL